MADQTSDGTPTGTSNSPGLPPLRSAMRTDDEAFSPRTGPIKVVSIAEPEGNISPLLQADDQRKKHFASSSSKRMVPRRPSFTMSPRLSSVSDDLFSLNGSDLSYRRQHEKLISQVTEWLQAEKAMSLRRKAHKTADHDLGPDGADTDIDPTISLETLQRILEESKVSLDTSSLQSSPSLGPRRPSLLGHPRASKSRASSDTDYVDGDVMVPNCDVILDNSKTMSYTGGAADDGTAAITKREEKERKAWTSFKTEIVKLTHTLKLKGWRRVPLDRGAEIDVERLSGALTNAVYVVAPPKDLPPPPPGTGFKKPPPKLLLRIYGPQVEHLIDRESELGILQRLARKKIGPRLLGTFKNGRFEEFLHATTLTSADLRVPATSKQIAKRMRELHDGIDLLERERDSGPFVWCNWDKWQDRVEQVITFADKKYWAAEADPTRPSLDHWYERGLLCGVEWATFKAAIDKYRKWLDEKYGGAAGIRNKLVFAHNDTQYGNILRLKPSGESPLLLPANEHKQLVVIDFEYASANLPGLEFANHFSEWCYNYHDELAPHACNHQNYPTVEEQRRFIRSYVNHRPQFNPKASATPSQTPKLSASGPSSSVSSFMLDARTPAGVTLDESWREEEERREKAVSEQVEKLMAEARIWRVANSAQWIAWGIVQAKVPGLDVDENESKTENHDSNGVPQSDPLTSDVAALKESHDHDQRPEGGMLADALRNGESLTPALIHEAQSEGSSGGDDVEEEFDYLGYAQQRAMFFWGDMVQLGLVTEEELPENIRGKLKIVTY